MTTAAWDADCWRQWGFFQHTQPETTTNTPPHSHLLNLATNPNQPITLTPSWQTTNQAVSNTQTTPTLLAPNNRQQPSNPSSSPWQTQNISRLPAPPTPPGNNWAPGNPIPIQDNYLEPWGNHLQQLKPPNTFCICLQNFGAWPTLAKQKKQEHTLLCQLG